MIYLVHDVTGASTEVPDDPDVLADYAGRGWQVTDRPYPIPFSPSPDGLGQRDLNPDDYAPADLVSNDDDVPPDTINSDEELNRG